MGENSGQTGTKEIKHDYDLPDTNVINLVPRVSKVLQRTREMIT